MRKSIEHFDRQAARIPVGLQHHRRHGTDQHRFADTTATAVLRDVTRDFATARGVTDVNGILQIEMRSERGDIGGVGVHLVACVRLRGPAVTATIVRDHAKALRQEEHHLRVPIVGAQRPAVVEHDGLPAAPILVENFGAVFGFDEAHRGVLLR